MSGPFSATGLPSTTIVPLICFVCLTSRFDGDKPIIALFPAGIVTFEVTMLFAIIGTMVIAMYLPLFNLAQVLNKTR